jgi:hypothetical protein
VYDVYHSLTPEGYAAFEHDELEQCDFTLNLPGQTSTDVTTTTTTITVTASPTPTASTCLQLAESFKSQECCDHRHPLLV